MLANRLLISLLFLLCCQCFASSIVKNNAYTYLQQIVSAESGIGTRPSGSVAEKDTAKYIINKLKAWGITVEQQKFSVSNQTQQFSSSNVIANIGNSALPTIVLGAHYDSKGEGSNGAIDNGTGVAAMLEIARLLAKAPPSQYNIRFIAFGAEEIAISGSQYYVNHLSKKELNNIVAMINLDMVAGGDNLYIHSAQSTPYPCGKTNHSYNGEPVFRQALMRASKATLTDENQFIIHQGFDNYAQGETGPWSDHLPFSCAGIPIAFIESTNFAINGRYGFDGLAQTSHPNYWDCFDKGSQGACNRKTEQRWGIILHSKHDSLEAIEAAFPNRINRQLNNTVTLVSVFLSAPEQYLNNNLP